MDYNDIPYSRAQYNTSIKTGMSNRQLLQLRARSSATREPFRAKNGSSRTRTLDLAAARDRSKSGIGLSTGDHRFRIAQRSSRYVSSNPRNILI